MAGEQEKDLGRLAGFALNEKRDRDAKTQFADDAAARTLAKIALLEEAIQRLEGRNEFYDEQLDKLERRIERRTDDIEHQVKKEVDSLQSEVDDLKRDISALERGSR